MARPRIFVSSTYYDLKHLRASLENFIDSLGYESVLSEKGDIAYSPDIALDESCYREVRNTDIFVLIIGGRYGTEKSESRSWPPKPFFDRYDSITKGEYQSAVDKDIPIYVLIEKPVYSDFETFLRNKNNTSVEYAHVDSVNVFHLIEKILEQPRNNPIKQFDKYSEVESWLREQWAGQFREMLMRASDQRQIASLVSQVRELAEVSDTLKTYLEQVVSQIAPGKAAELIEAESERLLRARQLYKISDSNLGRLIRALFQVPPKVLHEHLFAAPSFGDFLERLRIVIESFEYGQGGDIFLQKDRPNLYRDANQLRSELGLTQWLDP